MKSIFYLLFEGIKNLWKNRTMSLASVAVLISCLLLTGTAALLSLNTDNIMKELEADNNVTVYLYANTPKLNSIKIGEEIRAIENISHCNFVSSEDALADIMIDMGNDGTLFEGMDDFLPDAYNINMKDLTLYDQTIEAITAIEGVEKCTDFAELADKLTNLDTFIWYAGIAVVSILSVISLFIISNTIKVTMFSRRVEIRIMKSVGATNMFIRIPFLVEGMLIGLISGAISCSILYLAYDKITEAVYSIVPFLSVIDIEPYVSEIYVIYLILGALFGIMGGVITMGRYLNRDGEKAV